jgi:hypothetical protein
MLGPQPASGTSARRVKAKNAEEMNRFMVKVFRKSPRDEERPPTMESRVHEEFVRGVGRPES